MKYLAYILCLFFFINKAAYPITTDLYSDYNYKSIVESISALSITRTKYQKKIIKDNKMNKEYALFIDFLSFKINDYCQQLLKKYGQSAIKEISSCKIENLSEKKDKNKQTKTSEEKVESIEDEFTSALGNFDEMILAENDSITHRKKKKKIKIEKKSAQQSISQIKGKHKQTSTTGYKRKKINKTDDDIVARQLKEAAEQEKDPKLKEKLWNEYYKYKQSVNKETNEK